MSLTKNQVMSEFYAQHIYLSNKGRYVNSHKLKKIFGRIWIGCKANKGYFGVKKIHFANDIETLLI